MKFRKGFVTNSSSSSFILGFKEDEDVRYTIFSIFPKYIKSSYVGYLIDEIETNLVNFEDAANEYAYYTGDRYSKESINYKKAYDDFVREFHDQYSKFSVIEVSDNDGEFWSMVEHDILPNAYCTLLRISHH